MTAPVFSRDGQKASEALDCLHYLINCDKTHINQLRDNPPTILNVANRMNHIAKVVTNQEKAVRLYQESLGQLSKEEKEWLNNRYAVLLGAQKKICNERIKELRRYEGKVTFNTKALAVLLAPAPTKPRREGYCQRISRRVKEAPGAMARNITNKTLSLPYVNVAASSSFLIGAATLTSMGSRIMSTDNLVVSAARVGHAAVSGALIAGAWTVKALSNTLPKATELGLSYMVSPVLNLSAAAWRTGAKLAVSAIDNPKNLFSKVVHSAGVTGPALLNNLSNFTNEKAAAAGRIVGGLMTAASKSADLIADSSIAQGALGGALLAHSIAKNYGDKKTRANIYALGTAVGAGIGKMADMAAAANPGILSKTIDTAVTGVKSAAAAAGIPFSSTPTAEGISSTLSSGVSAIGEAIQNNPEIAALAATAVVVGAVYKSGHLDTVTAALARNQNPILAAAAVGSISLVASPVAASAIAVASVAKLAYNFGQWLTK